MSIVKKLKSIQCKFFCGHYVEHRKFHLVAWNEIKKPMKLGRLGVRLLIEMNRALQGKWLWRFMNEEGTLWRRIIAAKVGVEDRGWFSGGLMRGDGHSLWKKIGAGKENFLRCIRWQVGQGNRLNFWTDNWLEGGSLRRQFPKNFQLSRIKNAEFMIALMG